MFDFPNVPTTGQLATTPGGIYKWDGAKWAAVSSPTVSAGVSSWNTRTGDVALLQADLTALGDLRDVGRNRLHNGGFRFNQRLYVSSTALAAAAYGHDRWKAGASGCTYTFTQVYPTTTVTITAGTLQQVVEDRDVEGGSYVLSWTGTAQGRINAGAYAASPVTATGLTAGTAITVEFNTGTLGTVQLEPGTTATPFERINPAIEIVKCQRFFQHITTGMFGINPGAGIAFSMIGLLPVLPRISPTYVLSGQTYTNASAATVANFGRLGSFQAGATATASGVASFYTNVQASADL